MNETTSNQSTLDDAIEHCRRITKSRARNFYYGLRLAPEPKRSALYTLYAWMRAADDLVDDSHASNRESTREDVMNFLDQTHTVIEARSSEEHSESDPLWIAMADLAERYTIDSKLLSDMIDGQLADIDEPKFETFEELKTYCYRVASTVGLLCISIWGYEDDRARLMAFDRGIAFQLTNILRDYAEDYDRGRVYLPNEDFQRAGLTPAELRQWTKPATCRAFVQDQVMRAKKYYNDSRNLDVLISPDCRPVLWAMTTIYRGILDRIGDLPDRLIHGAPVRISPWRKGIIALEAKRRANHAKRRSRFADAVAATGNARE